MAIAQQQRGPVPFTLATKPTYGFVGQSQYRPGQGDPVKVTNAKLLARLVLTLSGTMHFSQPAGAGAPSFRSFGPWNLLKNLQVRSSGTSDPVNVSGWALHQRLLDEYPGYVSPSVYPLPAANGGGSTVNTDETWTLHYEVPVAVSDEDLTGLVMMQAREVTVEVVPQFADPTEIMTLPNGTTASFSGTLRISGLFFEIPADPRSLPNLSVLHQLRMFSTPLTTAGRTDIYLPLGDILRRVTVVVIAGGEIDTTDTLGLQQLDFRYSANYHQYVFTKEELRHEMAKRRRAAAPAGVYTLYFDQQAPRDLLDTSRITDLRCEVTVSQAPPANSALLTIMDQLTRLR